MLLPFYMRYRLFRLHEHAGQPAALDLDDATRRRYVMNYYYHGHTSRYARRSEMIDVKPGEPIILDSAIRVSIYVFAAASMAHIHLVAIASARRLAFFQLAAAPKCAATAFIAIDIELFSLFFIIFSLL